jgi:Castor and Pollux, part of voltage-gated ion channel
VRCSFDHAVVCGYLAASDGRLHINPPESAQLGDGDRVIALADNGALGPGAGGFSLG